MPDPLPSSAAGRFAPSPTGPLHLGSLVAAVGSWLFARSAGGRWLVRMEDLDRPREVPGAAQDILRTLDRLGLSPDEPVARQSERTELFEEALRRLEAAGRVYPCACSRSELRRVASAPEEGDSEPVYPGTCRDGLPPGRAARAVRFRVAPGEVSFRDAVFGQRRQDVARAIGDFVIRRADGYFAYQLAVVVDDAAQAVSQVVRGADLLDSTPRQIALAGALGLSAPAYAHLPLVLAPDGSKLSKRHGAIAVATLSEGRAREALAAALAILGQEAGDGTPREMLERALSRFDPSRIPTEPAIAPEPAG